MTNWKQDLTLSLVLLAIAAGFYFGGLGYPRAAFLFPSYLSPMLGGLALLLGLSALRRKEAGARFIDWPRYKAPAMLVGLVAAYIGLLPVIGYIPASFLLSAAFFLAMGLPSRKLGLAVAAAASVLVYVLFAILLEVPLPHGVFFEGN